MILHRILQTESHDRPVTSGIFPRKALDEITQSENEGPSVAFWKDALEAQCSSRDSTSERLPPSVDVKECSKFGSNRVTHLVVLSRRLTHNANFPKAASRTSHAESFYIKRFGMFLSQQRTPQMRLSGLLLSLVFGVSVALECGRSLQDSSDFQGIINGDVAPPQAHPWFAKLSDGYRGESFCGATVISNRWILTAAHCLGGQTIFVDVTRAKSSPTVYGVKRKILYENYRAESLPATGDIGLIETEEEIEFNEFVQPICIPRNDSNLKVGVKALAIGYGLTRPFDQWILGLGPYEATYADELLQIEAEVRPAANCTGEFEFGFASTFGESFICYGSAGKNVCEGDSGGPMLRKESGTSWQYGVVSIGMVGCPIGSPSAFTRVSTYCDWIAETTDGEATCIDGNL